MKSWQLKMFWTIFAFFVWSSNTGIRATGTEEKKLNLFLLQWGTLYPIVIYLMLRFILKSKKNNY